MDDGRRKERRKNAKEEEETHLEGNLDDGLSDQSGTEKLPEGQLEEPREDSSEVEEGVWDGGHEEDAKEAEVLHDLEAEELHAHSNRQVLSRTFLGHELGEFLIVLGLLSGRGCGQGKEVRRELPDGSSCSPAEALPLDDVDELEKADVKHWLNGVGRVANHAERKIKGEEKMRQ